MRRALAPLALLALAGLASAQQRGNDARLGASVNAYFFSDSVLRNAFGNPTLSYGVNVSALNRPRANRPGFAYNIITAARDDSRLFLLPLTLGYEKQFGDRAGHAMPYARIEGGVAYYDVAIHNGGFDQSFKAGGLVGAAEVGIILNRTVALRARYNLFQEKFGLNVSGAEVGITYNFASF